MINLTPSFQSRLSALRCAGSDTGTRYTAPRRDSRYKMRYSHVTPQDTAPLSEQLKRVPAATDRHSISCRAEVVADDAVVCIERRTAYASEGSRFNRRRRPFTEFHLVVGRVARIEYGSLTRTSVLVLSTDDGEKRLTLDMLDSYGCWRMPWDDELLRDRRLAAHLVSSELAASEIARFGNPPSVADF